MVNPENFLITNEYVREALDQIIQAMPATSTNPLQVLHLIDLHMITADFTFFQDPRKFAVDDLLISIVHDQYIYQRALHSFSAPQSNISLVNAIETIKEDATTGNSDLIGWSWVYFHYVEISLQISQQLFCHTVRLDDRTIRRYHSNTIDKLTKYLIRLEQDAREVRRRQILYGQLPHKGTISDLIGREPELQLIRNTKLRHFYIVGSAGIGKTVLVEQILKEQIDNNKIDHIVWIHSPLSIENVKSYLYQQLLGQHSKITLFEYISLKKVTVVIDNSEKLQKDNVQLQAFLEEFSNANVFLTSQFFHPIPQCLQISLSELSFSAVLTILSDRQTNRKTPFEIADYARLIWQSVGGNPLTVELLDQNWSILGFDSATVITLNQLFSNMFDSMSRSEHLAWLILAFLDNETSNLSDLSKGDFPYVTLNDFIMLERLFVTKPMKADHINFTLSKSASYYIQLRYKSSIGLQDLVEQLVENLVATSSFAGLNLDIIEGIMTVNWVVLSPDNYLSAARQTWKQGLSTGHYTKWYVILGKLINELTPQNVDLAIGYGICQKHLGQWTQAHSIFTAVAQFTGMSGLFSTQADALLELAVLLHYQGDYAGAIVVLNRIDTYPDPAIANLDLRNKVIAERIEIELERNNLADAKSLFTILPNEEIRRRMLQLEIYAKDVTTQIDLLFLESLGKKLLSDYSYSPSLKARIHILIGRVYQSISDVKSATKHLGIAHLLLTDIDNDPFALARTQSNLAALLMDSNQFIDAQELLKSAASIQRKIGDRVGLAATQHNEHVLVRKIVN